MLKAKLLGATAGAEVLAIEDVFSTYLYTGNGTSQTITNGIDLAGEGGMVWLKARSAANSHAIYDTLRGNTLRLNTNTNGAAQDTTTSLSSFNSNGFSLSGSNNQSNESPTTYASWTFRQAPRFFDVVTYTGNGGTARAISHDLGVTPGMVIVKRTNAAQSWHCLHKDANLMFLDTTDAAFSTATTATRFGDGTNVIRPNSTTFTVTGSTINNSGDTYVAYLFAHDPLGPSGDGSDGLIACGSYTGNGSNTGPVINLGWEPQWLLVKDASSGGTNWTLVDSMRGFTATGVTDAFLKPNTSDAEDVGSYFAPTATGFILTDNSFFINSNGNTYIYIAIRRGPMREPTSGTEVFSASSGDTTQAKNLGLEWYLGYPVDMFLGDRQKSSGNFHVSSRLTGSSSYLKTNTTDSQASTTTDGYKHLYDNQFGIRSDQARNSAAYFGWMFRRAPGFFDVVAYTGDGVAGRTVPHNLGVAPELMIVKNRGDVRDWIVYHAALGATYLAELNTTAAAYQNSSYWPSAPTASVFSPGNASATNRSGYNHIAYLFATLPGVSKVGSYTGNGSSQTINCGFTSGARFVLIKRTDSTGDWYVWDTARGIVTGNDPHLSLNTTAAEVTTDDTIDPDSTGFIVNQVAATNVNVNAATYIYLAIA